MEELFKNSLMGHLKELGFNAEIQEEPNPLAIQVNGDIKDSPFADNPIKEAKKSEGENIREEVSKKRLNDFDFDILRDSAVKKASDEFSGANALGKFLYRYFPKIYKSFLIKKALDKLNNLNQTASDLVSKKIPYGESDKRYDALSEYLSSANTIHAKLLKKI